MSSTVESGMAILQSFCAWLQATPVATFIAGSTWAFPAIETVHVLSLAMVVGTIGIVDLRLLGVASRDLPVSALSRQILPLTWSAFAGAAVTGALMFSSRATHYFANGPFRLKMALLLMAGLNMLVFHTLTYRDVERWDGDLPPPLAARIAGLLSLTLWVGVVVFGRWTGFTVR